MSTLLVNKIKSVTGDTVTISGSNVIIQGSTTLGDNVGNDPLLVRDTAQFEDIVHFESNVLISSSDFKVSSSNDVVFEGNNFGEYIIDGFPQGVKFKGGSKIQVEDADVNVSGSLNLSGSLKFTPNVSQLPTSDPGVSGQVFITGSTGMNLGGITGSGTFKILCVSAG